MNPNDTIAAIATPPGEGGVAIIRVSGKEALKVAAKVFSKDPHAFSSHTAHFGQILDGEQVVDEGLLMPMLGKRSYPGEDTVEIFCHGGSLVARRVLESVLKAGARAANPGEFTFRAYLNGKIDLAQAEAVQALIHAKNERMLDAAQEQLQGRLSQKVEAMQKRLTLIAAILEAWVDFPDEGLEFEPMEKVIADLTDEKMTLEQLSQTFHEGRIIQAGLKVALIGAPNVGKSSLMNALLDKERAIVSPIAGTTRDIVEDHLRLSGLNLILTDTAGIRTTRELIEQEGIRRSKAAQSSADLILLILDASRPLTHDEHQLLQEVSPHKTIVIWNKSDISLSPLPPLACEHVVVISALEKKGLVELTQMIDRVIWQKGPPSKEELVITNVRHKEALDQAAIALQKVIEGLKQGVSPEFVALDMRHSLQCLGAIIGTDITEDILSAIFNKFCIGK